ncbi:hypothetical protein HK104_004844 [Borealophlyctis nickersoniae]|nr:hypothetical protein HK104_004844 [Borealophlyctis nickersoniae]
MAELERAEAPMATKTLATRVTVTEGGGVVRERIMVEKVEEARIAIDDGLSGDIADHLSSCPYENIKGYILMNEARIAKLEATIADQNRELEKLRSKPLNKLVSLNGSEEYVFLGELRLLKQVREIDGSQRNSPLSSPAASDEEGETWPLGNIKCRRTVAEHRTGVTSLAYHNGVLYSGAYDGTTKIFNAESGQLIRTVRGHTLSVWSTAVHAQSNRFFTAGSDGTIKVSALLWANKHLEF